MQNQSDHDHDPIMSCHPAFETDSVLHNPVFVYYRKVGRRRQREKEGRGGVVKGWGSEGVGGGGGVV